jgi:general secretion pathway protein E
VRVLCPNCKKAVPITQEEDRLWDHLVSPWKANHPTQFYHPVGCLDCRMTGYRGRVGIYEILLLSKEIKQAIVDGADIEKIRDMAYRTGMKPLRISGAMKIVSGMTTLSEVYKVAAPTESA